MIVWINKKQAFGNDKMTDYQSPFWSGFESTVDQQVKLFEF